MKCRLLSPAILVALLFASVAPAVLHADTIYYRKLDVAAIQSVSGTIARETDDAIEIATADGRTMSIPRRDVFQIIREAPSAQGSREQASPAHSTPAHSTAIPSADPLENYHATAQFPAASAAARGTTLDDMPSRSRIRYHYGFKGGMSRSNVRIDPQELEDSGSLLGYALGIWWGVPVAHRVSIQAEALFSMKGDSESAGGFTTSTRLGYVDLPVLAKINFFPDSPVQPSLFAGPQFGFNVSGHSKLEGDGGEVDVDVKDQVGTVDLAFAFGAGLDFQRGGRTFGLDVRYSRGMSDIEDGDNGNARNEVIAAMGSVGLR